MPSDISAIILSLLDERQRQGPWPRGWPFTIQRIESICDNRHVFVPAVTESEWKEADSNCLTDVWSAVRPRAAQPWGKEGRSRGAENTDLPEEHIVR